jgi:hypothetical protein
MPEFSDVVSSLFKKKKTPEQVVNLLKTALLSIPGEDEREASRVSGWLPLCVGTRETPDSFDSSRRFSHYIRELSMHRH